MSYAYIGIVWRTAVMEVPVLFMVRVLSFYLGGLFIMRVLKFHWRSASGLAGCALRVVGGRLGDVGQSCVGCLFGIGR